MIPISINLKVNQQGGMSMFEGEDPFSWNNEVQIYFDG